VKRTHADFDRPFDVVAETDTAQAAVMTVPPGQTEGGPDNYHADSDQWLYVVSGSGRATVDGEDVPLGAGDLLCIEAGEPHAVTNDDDHPLETLNLYVPPRPEY
jgi:mannose-6-phosphate isomerase-like protein (cupin superfamily)